jgi:hypothetical protein
VPFSLLVSSKCAGTGGYADCQVSDTFPRGNRQCLFVPKPAHRPEGGHHILKGPAPGHRVGVPDQRFKVARPQIS